MSNNKNGPKDLRGTIIETYIDITKAQLNALEKMRYKPPQKKAKKKVGISQVDLVEDILTKTGKALHISDIITLVHQHHGVLLERDSIVSALTKKVVRGDRFVRTAKNTFRLKANKDKQS
jgi:hypothetical protein